MKALHPFCTVLERGFGSPTISGFGHCARVLRTEAFSQTERAITLEEICNNDANYYAYDKHNRDCGCVHVTDLLLLKACFRGANAPKAKRQTGSKRYRK